MDIPWGSDIANRFITNVGLVTSNGVHGHNIMACEWAYQLSYRPALMGVIINPRHATHDNIRETKEFGVCIASINQGMLTSVSGKASGRNYDKIKVAEELGFTFSKAKTINVLICDGAAAKLECKLFREISLGDHTLFVGEVTDGDINASVKPLAHHAGKYWDMTTLLEKPTTELREKINILFDKHHK